MNKHQPSFFNLYLDFSGESGIISDKRKDLETNKHLELPCK